MHIIKTAKLKVENSAQTSFKFSPVSFCAPKTEQLGQKQHKDNPKVVWAEFLTLS
jgi:hypothetical protein